MECIFQLLEVKILIINNKKKKVMKNGTRNAVLGFVAGAATGTLAGLLIAPEKGSKTRKKISKKVNNVSKDVTDTLNEKVDNLKDQVTEIINEMKGNKVNTGEKAKVKTA
jgi:gas vesicle protein